MFKKTIGWLLVIFFLGGLAGMLGSQLFLPWLAGFAPFDKIAWIARSKTGTTIINTTQQVVVQKDQADLETIGRLQNSVVAVRSEQTFKIVNKKSVSLAKSEFLAEGSGFILTSDGLVATADVLLPVTADKISVFWHNKEYTAKIIKRDSADGLAVLKIEETNLPTTALGANNLKLGQEIFSLGARVDNTGAYSIFVGRGHLMSMAPDLAADFKVIQSTSGGLMSDLDGHIIGLNLVNQAGDIKIIGVEKIRELMK